MDKAARSANSSTALFALSAFSATASILEAASTALAAASLASFTLLSILAESAVTLSSAALAASLASVTLLSTLAESAVTLSSAALAAALASAVSCARLSTRVFTAVTSSPISSNWSEMSLPISATDLFRSFTPVATSAIRVPLVVMAVFSSSMVLSCSSKAASVSSNRSSTRALTAVRPPAKPTPFRLSASISSLVALRTVFLPLASVVMKFEPDAKPLMVCSNSKVFKSSASLSFLKVSLPVSLSNVVPSPKTVKNAAFP